MLERAGYAVATAPDDSTIAPVPPALIIADLSAIAGLATLYGWYPAARFLALSDAEPATEAQQCLVKPFTASQLLAAVRRCLAR